MPNKLKGGGGTKDIVLTTGTSFDFDVPKEIKSSWRFLFFPLSLSSESAGGGD
jgi:hypothetical protein